MVTWNLLSNTADRVANAMWLMQDGAVLVCLGDGETLKSLRPDLAGSYANDWWSDAGKFQLAKLNFASAVLSDGRLVACGGEQSGPGFPTTETNFCEIYDPRAQLANLSSTDFPNQQGYLKAARALLAELQACVRQAPATYSVHVVAMGIPSAPGTTVKVHSA
jgi:hypothetical protein